MPVGIKEQRTKLTMNHLTILPIYNIGIFADYSRPQSASDERQATSNESKLSNEPNPVLPALSIFEGSEVEWISKITHFNNKQRTMNNELCTNEPNLRPFTHLINEQPTINTEHCTNEPNFRQNKRKFCYNKVLYQ